MKPQRHFPEFILPLDPTNAPLRRSSAVSMGDASQRILIVRTGANGDILMGTPLLAALREAWPQSHITWMVDPREREAIDANPLIDEILLWDTMYWKQMTRRCLYPLWFIRALQMRRMIQDKRFDTFISLQPEDWPTLARILNSANRIGVFDTFREYHRQTKTSRRSRLYSKAFTYGQHPPHRVDQYLLPLEALGISPSCDKRLSIGWTAADQLEADDYIAREFGEDPFVVVAPMTGWPSRVWPLERWAAVADGIAERLGLRVVLVSGPGAKDRSGMAVVTGAMRTQASVAAGIFGFRALAALIDRAALLISGDTGPMHVASAVRTPYVALFGPSPVERFAPLVGEGLTLSHNVGCGPCHQLNCGNSGEDHQLCLKRITVEEVIQAAQRLTRTTSGHEPIRFLPMVGQGVR